MADNVLDYMKRAFINLSGGGDGIYGFRSILSDASGSPAGVSANPLQTNPAPLSSASDSISSEDQRATYVVAGSFTPDASSSSNMAVMTLTGPAGLVARCSRWRVWPRCTTGTSVQFALNHFLGRQTTGTTTTVTIAQPNASDAPPASVFKVYTAKPGTGMSLNLGALAQQCFVIPSTGATVPALTPADLSPAGYGMKFWQLTGTADYLGMSFPNGVPSGMVLDYEVVWTEAAT